MTRRALGATGQKYLDRFGLPKYIWEKKFLRFLEKQIFFIRWCKIFYEFKVQLHIKVG
jgi:hypothetical protein